MESSIAFVLDGGIVRIQFPHPAYGPTTTVLNFLRSLPGHRGVKEGCAEGDCGACTVVLGELNSSGRIRYRSVDSCLLFLPMLDGKELVTVENVANSPDELHPVQQAMVDTGGSQCGYCTPGIIMSLFSLYKQSDRPSREEIDDALTGNLCRCTGYRPIVEAASRACVHEGNDRFSARQPETARLLESIPRRSVRIQTGTQSYFRPASLGEAVALKHRNPDAIVISGATDVALRVTKRHELLTEIIDLMDVEDLRSVTDFGNVLHVGSGVRLSDLIPVVRESVPALSSMLSVFGSQQIRNLATLGGNLGTASPIGDMLPVLIACNARVVLESLDGRREFPVSEFVTGYRRTLRKPHELITTIVIPKPQDGAIVKSYKVSKRKDLDISTVSGGFRLEVNGRGMVESVILAYGGMAERVKRAETAESFLCGKRWSREVVEQAMPLVDRDFSPISDARSGAEFRRIAARNLLLKFWTESS